MAIAQTAEPTPRKPLRLWPGVLAAVLLVLVRFVLPLVVPDALIIGVLGGLAGALVILLWWMFFSRAPWSERLGALALMIVALAGTRLVLLHESIAGGMMGYMFFMYALPALTLAFVVWAVATRRLADGPRRATMAATILLACGAWALVRTGGITGDADSDFHWRWSPTPEERLLAQAGDARTALPPAAPAAKQASAEEPRAQAGDEPAALPSAPAAAETAEEEPATPATDEPAAPPAAPAVAQAGADWPGFRGPQRDGIVRGVRIATDWSASPPVELWRRPIGPGWSSFAVRGDRFYTQEQRGDDEVVACYKVTTGEPVWGHRDAARFWESNAGAGPRGTPTLSNGRVYTLGATGILNALDAESGAVVWSRNAGADTKTEVPGWGFASSPLVVDNLVIVAAEGKLVAYDAATGDPRWFGPDGRSGYSSPHLLTIGGVPQVLLLSGRGATSVAPADGKVLWEHALPSGARIVQPALTADGDVLVSDGEFGDGNHMRRIAVTRGPGGWTVEERWSSMGLKPNFNDFVVHKGHAFGFDGRILSCIDLADGKRKWKGGHYGHGQLVLLPDQDLLLVLSEQGELALVQATPDQFTELARFPAIAGKTWNHPVLAGDVLLVRNGEEMAAFRLSLAGR
ncbi:MAG TPA: PQQ-binding-like beta-propeller repeat protein [Thermoanaerobaculia bacterium]|jgi:outer membrane protein assembly factor BamB